MIIKKEFDCYTCRYRGTIPGDAHSCCHHPKPSKCNIKGNAHGIRKGWFLWPLNFDPVWLDNCEGYAKSK